MRILTGSTGTSHITAADDGALYAGLAGKGSYVLNLGQQFKATVQSATSIKLGDGDGILQGRHFRTDPGDSDLVEIEENSAGTNRNDIIGVKYSAVSGIESMAWQVVKGAAVSGTAPDPSYNEGNLLTGGTAAFMPMYRVKIVDASISEIEPMFSVLQTLDELDGRTDPLDILHGGTRASTAAEARTNLGVMSTDEVNSAITSKIASKIDAVSVSGNGNVVTDMSKSENTISAVKAAYGTTVKEGNVATEECREGFAISVKTTLAPVQSGSGDPSPDNVRPISGWTGVTLTRCGKNLLSKAAAGTQTSRGITFTSNGDGSYTIKGTSTGSISIEFTTEVPITIPVGAYLHVGNTGALNGNIAFVPRFTDGTTVSFAFTVENRVWKISDGYVGKTIKAIGIYVNGVQTVDVTLKPMMCLDGASGEFEPYHGDTYTAEFGQTVYGGTLDWATGILTVTHGQIAAYAGESLPGAWISDRDVYAPGTVPTTGAQVVYKLATPTAIQLTPQQITALDGTNTVYSNGYSDYVIFNGGAVANMGIVNLIYPVGSIYMSVNNVSPATLFGGTWEQIKDTFLLSAGDTYAAGVTGGEAEHTLSVAELPDHIHHSHGFAQGGSDDWSFVTVKREGHAKTQVATSSSSGKYAITNTSTDNISYPYYTLEDEPELKGGAHNNMPPYLAVYVWKRTA